MALTYSRSVFLQALTQLRDLGPEEESLGICFNGSSIVDEICKESADDIRQCFYDFMCRESTDWPLYSGNSLFPVPLATGTKWSGEQGKLRYELIDFLISKLVEEDRKA